MRYNPATDQAKTIEELAFKADAPLPHENVAPTCDVCGGGLDANGNCIDLGLDLSRFDGVA